MTTTLSQIGLSIHLGKSAAWIRARGKTVSWRGETWSRWESSTTGRLVGYMLRYDPDFSGDAGEPPNKITPSRRPFSEVEPDE